jgi:hypothetical protein
LRGGGRHDVALGLVRRKLRTEPEAVRGKIAAAVGMD